MFLKSPNFSLSLNQQNHDTMSNRKNYQIPLSEAQLWTTIWRIACPTNCKAFLIPIEDLMGVLTEMGVLEQNPDGSYTYDEGSNRDIRAYMGINPKNKKGNPEDKILLVGTEKVPNGQGGYKYKDIINGHVWEKGDDMSMIGDGDDDSGVYDFTEPCPDACDDDSPINGGG